MSGTYPITRRGKAVRRHERGRHDKASVHAILDASLAAHVSCVMDGQPFRSPTAFWREGEHVCWHGSSASRMIRFQKPGVPVCVTVMPLDALVPARPAFHHSVNYRSAMAFGTARMVEGEVEKRRAMDGFIDRFYPGRPGLLRDPTASEIKAATFIVMEIAEASAKIRDTMCGTTRRITPCASGPRGIRSVRQVTGAAEPCPRQHPDAVEPVGMAAFREGQGMGEVMTGVAGASTSFRSGPK